MKTKILLLFLLSCAGIVFGQEQDSKKYFDLSFEKDTICVYNLIPKNEKIIEIGIRGKYISDEVKQMKIVTLQNNLTKGTEVKLNFNQKKIKNIDFSNVEFKENVYLTIKLDSLIENVRTISYKIIGLDSSEREINSNTGENKEIVIVFKNKVQKLENYKYLSYIGTNFDLVEGIKAENLFFATNVLLQPSSDSKDFGFYVSLYGNRTMSLKEQFEQEIITEIIPSPSIENLSYRLNKHVETIRTKVSDNLGVHFSLLFPIFGTRNSNNLIKSYATASTDFIWKRMHINTEYGEITKIDSLRTSSTNQHIILNPLRNTNIAFNQYTFNVGPGIFFIAENEDISVRVHGAMGYTRNFILDAKKDLEFVIDKKDDIFFAGRIWITEPKTGITLQAEVMNKLIDPKPYYGVTLSKAFNLDKLVGFFSPITKR